MKTSPRSASARAAAPHHTALALSALVSLVLLGCQDPPARKGPAADLAGHAVSSSRELAVTIQTGNNTLVGGLGGTLGFGETEFTGWPSVDDSFLTADISGVFTNGINFFGTRYDGTSQVFIGSNGYVTFGQGFSGYTPSGIAYNTIPIVAAFYTDLMVNGTGRVFLDVDNSAADPCVTFTWHDVYEYSSYTANMDRFQIRLHRLAGGNATEGDPVGIEIRYEKLALTGHTAAGGWADGNSDGSTPTRVFGEVRDSLTAAMLNNATADTTYSNQLPATAGVYYWAPANIVLTGGGTQSTAINTAFSSPLTVHVSDAMDADLPGATVHFSMPPSGASAVLSSTTCITNAAGVCSVTGTANGTYGGYTATAFVTGDYFSPGISFSMTNTQVPAYLNLISGNNQDATAGQAFGAPLVAQVEDTSHNPIVGAVVTFTAPAAGASLSAASSAASTDGSGNTFFIPYANTTLGTYNIVASIAGFTQNFSATNIPQTFTLDFVTDGTAGTSLSGTLSQGVVQGSDATAVTANGGPGVMFSNWTGTGGFTSTSNPLMVIAVSQSMTITAHYVVAVTTTTAVASSVNPSQPGDAVTFTATVGPAFATGTVQFEVDGSNVGGPVVLTGSVATSDPVSGLSVGSHLVRAVYSGDSAYLGSNGTLTGGQHVAGYPSHVDLSSTINPSVYGEAARVTATVTSVGGGTPTGLVTLMEGATVLDTQPLDGTGMATLTAAALAAGATDLWVSYTGDAMHAAALSTNLSQLVVPKPSALSISAAPATTLFGQDMTLT